MYQYNFERKVSVHLSTCIIILFQNYLQIIQSDFYSFLEFDLIIGLFAIWFLVELPHISLLVLINDTEQNRTEQSGSNSVKLLIM